MYCEVVFHDSIKGVAKHDSLCRVSRNATPSARTVYAKPAYTSIRRAVYPKPGYTEIWKGYVRTAYPFLMWYAPNRGVPRYFDEGGSEAGGPFPSSSKLFAQFGENSLKIRFVRSPKVNYVSEQSGIYLISFVVSLTLIRNAITER